MDEPNPYEAPGVQIGNPIGEIQPQWRVSTLVMITCICGCVAGVSETRVDGAVGQFLMRALGGIVCGMVGGGLFCGLVWIVSNCVESIAFYWIGASLGSLGGAYAARTGDGSAAIFNLALCGFFGLIFGIVSVLGRSRGMKWIQETEEPGLEANSTQDGRCLP